MRPISPRPRAIPGIGGFVEALLHRNDAIENDHRAGWSSSNGALPPSRNPLFRALSPPRHQTVLSFRQSLPSGASIPYRKSDCWWPEWLREEVERQLHRCVSNFRDQQRPAHDEARERTALAGCDLPLRSFPRAMRAMPEQKRYEARPGK